MTFSNLSNLHRV